MVEADEDTARRAFTEQGQSENSAWQILRLPVSSLVSRRDPEERRRHREDRFWRYFAPAQELHLPRDSFAWEGLPLGQGRFLPCWRLQQLAESLRVKVLFGEG